MTSMGDYVNSRKNKVIKSPRQGETPEFEYGLYTEEEGILSDEYGKPYKEESEFPEKVDSMSLEDFDQLIPDSKRGEVLRQVRQRFPSKTPIDELFRGVPGGMDGAIGVADAVLGTVAQVPNVLGSMYGTVEGIAKSVADDTYGTQEGAKSAFDQSQQRAADVSEYLSGAGGYELKTEAGNKLMENLGNVTGRYVPPFLAGGVPRLMTGAPKSITRKQEMAEQIRRGNEDATLATFRLPDPEGFDSGRPIIKDREASAVIKQGLEPKTVQMVKQASNADKQRMLEMVELRKTGLTNLKDEQLNRPLDVAGKELQKTITKVVVAKRKAGQEVDRASKALRGVPIPGATAIGENFVASLKEALDVDFDPQKPGNVDFSNSSLDMTPGLQAIVSKVINSSRKDISDAYGLHTLKKGLDELINYEKEGQGLTGTTEVVLKRLRADIDGYLDGIDGDYDLANQQFGALADAYGSIRKVTGNKTEFDSAFADKQLGAFLRSLGGQSSARRPNLLAAIEKLQLVGGIKDTDLMALVLFAEKLDDAVGSSSAITSLQGDVARAGQAVATNQSAAQSAIELAKGVRDRARGINDENALESTRKLLLRDLNENKRRQSKLPVKR